MLERTLLHDPRYAPPDPRVPPDWLGHTWRQVSHGCNGPHLWQCNACGEWTRDCTQPGPHDQLIDPDSGEVYALSPSECHG